MTWSREWAQVCLRWHATSSTPSPFSRGELISWPNFLVGFWAQTKAPLCWEGGKESNTSGISDAESFFPLFPLQKAARPAAASRQEWADSLNKASSKTDLPFQGQTKRKRVGSLLKQWEVSFVGLKAEQRLTGDQNFNSSLISLV